MRSATWTSDNGYTVHFGGQAPYVFRRLSDSLGATAQTNKAPGQDGRDTLSVDREQHTVNLLGTLIASPAIGMRQNVDELIRHLHFAFDPKTFGTLTYTTSAEAVRIRCRPIALPTISRLPGNARGIDVEFTSDSDRWESAELYTAAIGYSMRRWVFAWIMPTVMGLAQGVATIDNTTPLEIEPRISIYSTEELVEIINESTGQSMTIQYPIEPDQKMVVDIPNRRAELWQRNAAGAFVFVRYVTTWLTIGSGWITLPPGVSAITVNKNQPSSTPLAVIEYRLPRLGVV